MGYALELPEIYGSGRDDFESINNQWYRALNGLPVGTLVVKQDYYFEKEYSGFGLPRRTYLEEATYRHFKEREYTEHLSYLFFVKPLKGLSALGLKNPFKQSVKKKFILEEEKELHESFVGEIERAVSFLNNSNIIRAHPLSPESLYELAEGYFLGFNENYYTDADHGIKEKVGDRTIHLKIGESFYGMYAVKNERDLPAILNHCVRNDAFSEKEFTFFKGTGDNMGIYIPYNHIYTQILSIDDHKKHIADLEKRRKTYTHVRNFSPENTTYSEMLKKYLEENTRNENFHLVRGHNNIIFWADSQEKFKKVSEYINTSIKDVDIHPYYPPRGNYFKHLYLNSFFAHANYLDAENDYYLTDLSLAVRLFTNCTNYKDDRAGILLNDRVTQLPLYKDTWGDVVKRIKARNFFIVGVTGEGKSVLGQHLMRQYKEQGVKQIIVDLGESFRKYALLYREEAAHISYEEGKSLGVNPFDIQELNNDRIEILASFIFALYKKSEAPTDNEQVALKRFIKVYYDNVNAGWSLESFYDFMNAHRDSLRELFEKKESFDFEDFSDIMSEFVHEGNYAFLFKADGNSIINDLDNKNIVVFELENVQKNPMLLGLMLLLINDVADKIIWKDRRTKGLILFEEFAKVLKFPQVLSGVEYTYQAARKYESAIGIVLQSIHQIPRNSESNSIFDNTQIHYVLNNPKGYDALVEALNYSEHEHQLLKSIRYDYSGKRPYSEVFIKMGKESNVYRLELPKRVRAAYLTEGTEHTKIMELYNQYGDMEQAIEMYINTQKTKL